MQRLVLSSTFPQIVGQLLSGSRDVPCYIGFVYGTNPDNAIQDPDAVHGELRGAFDAETVRNLVLAAEANIAVARLHAAPHVEVDGPVSVSYHSTTAAIFRMLYTEYAGFAADIREIEGSVYVYQLALMTASFEVVAMGALGSAPYDPKPTSFDLGATVKIALS